MTNQLGYASRADTNRNPSPSIWGNCPIDAINSGHTDGFGKRWNFMDGPIVGSAVSDDFTYGNGVKVYTSTGGAIAAGDEIGGTVALSSDGDDEGAAMQQQNFPFQISNSHGDLWFEARIKTSTIADTKHSIFLGLCETVTLSATVPIAAAGTLTDNNFVGFHRLEADGDYFNTVYKANGITEVLVKQDAALLVADTYIKLGFYHDASAKKLTFYDDGNALADTKSIPSAAGTDFPNDVRLGWVLAVLNATATTPGSTEIDWIQVYQKGV